MKLCKVCGRERPLSCFYKEDGYRDGLGRHQCIDCRNAASRARYAAEAAGLKREKVAAGRYRLGRFEIRREQHERLPDGLSRRALNRRLCWDWYLYRVVDEDLIFRDSNARFGSLAEAEEWIRAGFPWVNGAPAPAKERVKNV